MAALEQLLQDLPEQDATVRWVIVRDAIYSIATSASGKRE